MARFPVAYDFSRLASRIFSHTPNGIDRVDMAYARHFLSEGGAEDCGLLYLGPLGTRAVPREKAIEAIAGIEAHYAEAAEHVDTSLLARIAAWTCGRLERDEVAAPRVKPRRRPGQPNAAAYTLRTLSAAGRSAADALPMKARYLCVSQFPLSEAGAYRWLARRRDVRPVFFIHDLLPLQYPEYFRWHELARHQRRVEQLARIGAAALVSTRAMAELLRVELARLGRADMPIHVAPMPLAAAFRPQPPAAVLKDAALFFIQCGTIEPRKNHLTLLHAWRDMSAALGERTPKLILVGTRGWENENILDLLNRSPPIRAHVLELSGINTPSLVQLMLGARALLMPSFAEGYGLPVAEAMALGVPVIASDIPAFHEVTGGNFEAIAPIDGTGWREAVLRALKQAPARAFRPPQVQDFEKLRQFLDDLP